MARNRGQSAPTPEKYGASQWLAGVGGSAASGASAGMAAGPWGAAVGGFIGAGVGALQTAESEKAYLAQQQQQIDLQKELESTDSYDKLIQAQGLALQSDRQEARLQARQAAARAGLTPGESAALERQAVNEINSYAMQGLPSLYLTGQQMDQARRNQVLQEYQVAQSLADNSASPDYSAVTSGATSMIAQYLGQKNAADTTPAAGNQWSFAPVSPPENFTDAQWDAAVADPWGPGNTLGQPAPAVAPASAAPVSAGQPASPPTSAPAPSSGTQGAPAAPPTVAPAVAPGNGAATEPPSVPSATASPTRIAARKVVADKIVSKGKIADIDTKTKLDSGIKPETITAAEKGDIEALLNYIPSSSVSNQPTQVVQPTAIGQELSYPAGYSRKQSSTPPAPISAPTFSPTSFGTSKSLSSPYTLNPMLPTAIVNGMLLNTDEWGNPIYPETR